MKTVVKMLAVVGMLLQFGMIAPAEAVINYCPGTSPFCPCFDPVVNTDSHGGSIDDWTPFHGAPTLGTCSDFGDGLGIFSWPDILGSETCTALSLQVSEGNCHIFSGLNCLTEISGFHEFDSGLLSPNDLQICKDLMVSLQALCNL